VTTGREAILDAAEIDLDRAWERAVRASVDPAGPAVVLFSGGVDSGLLAWELRARPATELFTVGVPGARDLEAARSAAERIGLPWRGRELDPPTLRAVADELASGLEGVARPRRGIFVALACAIALAPAGTLVCGQGADELFLGYAHFRGLSAGEAAVRAEDDLARLRNDDLPRCAAYARRHGRTLVAPFLDPDVVRAAAGIPIADRLPADVAKPALRRLARRRGVPEAIVEAPKRAIQYGSGVDRWLRRTARGAPD
jgi:asparagine synthase (glutamine-hydrolysing)